MVDDETRQRRCEAVLRVAILWLAEVSLALDPTARSRLTITDDATVEVRLTSLRWNRRSRLHYLVADDWYLYRVRRVSVRGRAHVALIRQASALLRTVSTNRTCCMSRAHAGHQLR